MKHILKRVTVFTTMLALALGILATSTQTVSAASKPEMKKANVKWDLKKKKTVTYKSLYTGVGLKKQKAKISKMKVTTSKTKPGYKECTFTLKCERGWKMTNSEIHEMVKNRLSDNSVGGTIYCHIVDYNTGKSLFAPNTKGVTVETVKAWTHSKSTTYKDEDGCWVRLHNSTVTFKVTYPSNYKGLCIGLGGITKLSETSKDKKFSNGKVSFNKTSFYSKKDKSVAHFMRVK